MKDRAVAILKKVYFHENGFYNQQYERHEHRIPETISSEGLRVLGDAGLPPNNFETFNHDDALRRLLALKERKTGGVEYAASLFLKGITGELLRARQPLMSNLFTRHLYQHDFLGSDICTICGLPKMKTIDKTHVLLTYYLGNSWNENPLDFLIEREEGLSFEDVERSHHELEKLGTLIRCVADAGKDETPGQLEKRIAKNKILKKTDKYKRYGILMTLAECGILPNEHISPKYDVFTSCEDRWELSKKLKTSHRSDIVLPLAGWNGNNPVNYERFEKIFGTRVK